MLYPAGRYFLVYSCLTLSLLFQGCTALQTFPHVARAGDTITLAVGSPEGMTRDNTTVTYTPDSTPSAPIDLTDNIEAIFRLYPDKLSAAWLFSDAKGIEIDSGHGPWLSIIAINLPSGLPVGSGSLQVTTGAFYPPNGVRVNEAGLHRSCDLFAVWGGGSQTEYARFVSAFLG